MSLKLTLHTDTQSDEKHRLEFVFFTKSNVHGHISIAVMIPSRIVKQFLPSRPLLRQK